MLHEARNFYKRDYFIPEEYLTVLYVLRTSESSLKYLKRVQQNSILPQTDVHEVRTLDCPVKSST